MRKYHRWLSVFFGVFLLFIATTGVMSHVAAIKAQSEPRAAPVVPVGFVCPETMMCRPKPNQQGAAPWVGWLHHLHSGEEFGPVGTAISILSGLTLMFFSVSGLWLYIQMFRNRAASNLKPGWFWK
ncbi:MAG: PepSY domain-containing protein [Novosphingobium sp.]